MVRGIFEALDSGCFTRLIAMSDRSSPSLRSNPLQSEPRSAVLPGLDLRRAHPAGPPIAHQLRRALVVKVAILIFAAHRRTLKQLKMQMYECKLQSSLYFGVRVSLTPAVKWDPWRLARVAATMLLGRCRRTMGIRSASSFRKTAPQRGRQTYHSSGFSFANCHVFQQL